MARLLATGSSTRLTLLLTILLSFTWSPTAGAEPEPFRSQATSVGFLENRGQIDAEARYYAAGSRVAVYLTLEGVVFEIREHGPYGDEASLPLPDYPTRRREQRALTRARRYAMAIRFVDPEPSLRIEAAGRLETRHNFLVGGDAAVWRTDVPAFERVTYREVWPGIDLVYRLEGDRLTYRVVAAVGADLDRVRFRYEGATPVDAGDETRQLRTPLGTILDRIPQAGISEGCVRILESSTLGDPVADSASPSTPASDAVSAVDPHLGMALWWSSFLGGARDDTVYGVAISEGGHPIVVGNTRSTDFPTTLGVVQTDYAESFDAFVAKFEYDGSSLLWSTYLGGIGDDRGWTVKIDSSNRPVVAGVTGSTDFPVTSGAYDTVHNGDYDAYVARLAEDGSSVVWASYYGGSAREWDVSGLDLDSGDQPVISGSTRSGDLPTSTGAYDVTLNGTQDAFVAALTADGTALAYGSYLGGTDFDAAEDVSVDSTDRAVVAGSTSSTDFPTTTGALQETANGLQDAFVTQLTSDGSGLVFSSYLGGDGTDDAFALVVDAAGEIVVTGRSSSSNFPTTPGVVSPAPIGGGDIFLTRLSPDGSTQLWGTYFGGSGSERGLEVVLDSVGRPIVVGATCSDDFPLVGPPFNSDYFTCDGFVTRFTAGVKVALYSSYMGGWRDDSVYALAIDELDRIVAGGETFSTNFPSTSYAFQTESGSPNTWFDGVVFEMLTPRYCAHINGATVPTLLMSKAVKGNCPPGTPEGHATDLIEGRLEVVNAVDLGDVRRLACDSPLAIIENDLTPELDSAFFLLARYRPDGTYADGGDPGLVGTRIPAAGDCP